jgi:hypothetical protein
MALKIPLTSISPGFAQSNRGSVPPEREKNIYGHRSHQPSAANVCPNGAAESINCPSEATRRQVEEEVQKLLRDTHSSTQAARRQLDDSNGASRRGSGAISRRSPRERSRGGAPNLYHAPAPTVRAGKGEWRRADLRSRSRGSRPPSRARASGGSRRARFRQAR